MKIKVLLIALFTLNIFQVNAQNKDEVTLVVSADGATKEEATKVALRSAIEQAYGTFVSANTTILNDEMVKDEIVTISNGNIKQYKEIASVILPNGNQSVTLQATVCISKLISYAKSKGASTEFAGAAFMMNVKMKELNKKNERIVLNNLLLQVKSLSYDSFDRSIKMGTPKLYENNNYEVKCEVTSSGNNRYFDIKKLISSTFQSIALSDEEQKEYEAMGLGKTKYKIYILSEHSRNSVYSHPKIIPVICWLRNDTEYFDKWSHELLEIYCKERSDYKIIDNSNEIWHTGPINFAINSWINRRSITEYYGPAVKNNEYDKDYYYYDMFWTRPADEADYILGCYYDSVDLFTFILTADEMSKLTKIDVIRK